MSHGAWQILDISEKTAPWLYIYKELNSAKTRMSDKRIFSKSLQKGTLPTDSLIFVQ